MVRHTDRIVTSAIFLIILIFAAVLMRFPDRTFADDSYFYFQVAWNFARGAGSTFNNIMPTNGYHPLWMLVCAAVFCVVHSRPHAVYVIAAVISILDVLTLWTVRSLINKCTYHHLWVVSFLLLIPFSFGSQLGTEGALSCLFLSLLMLTAYRFTGEISARAALTFSVVSTLAVLSRLDNIFIVCFVALAVWLAPGSLRTRRRRLLLATATIPACVWSVYIASNWFFFHTIQPISGMLKANGGLDHKLGANLPHTAHIALAVMIPSFFVVALRRRDLFFRVVELPFALGVLCHALYIIFVMSSETRWTWYYTSWILLGSILLARAMDILLSKRIFLIGCVAPVCVLLLAAAWYGISYRRFVKAPVDISPAAFNAELHDRLGIRRALMFDEPGRYAYYSDIQIVPVDGLMGDMVFQHDLASNGIEEFVTRAHIDAFIGPVSPQEEAGTYEVCRKIFLSSEQFHCERRSDGLYNLTAVDVYSRIPPHIAGTLQLLPSDKLFELPNEFGVWRLRH